MLYHILSVQSFGWLVGTLVDQQIARIERLRREGSAESGNLNEAWLESEDETASVQRRGRSGDYAGASFVINRLRRFPTAEGYIRRGGELSDGGHADAGVQTGDSS